MARRFVLLLLTLVLAMSAAPAPAQDNSGAQSGGSATNPPPPPPGVPARIRLGVGIEDTQIVRKVAPVVPDADKGMKGTVVLHAVIDAKGVPSEMTYLSGPTELADAAVKAACEYRYKPLLLNHVAVIVETTISVTFNGKEETVSDAAKHTQ